MWAARQGFARSADSAKLGVASLFSKIKPKVLKINRKRQIGLYNKNPCQNA
jgi:hypothetical protein